ncbi:MAG: CocE/NonD family hydrolase [Pirellula sp.]
MSENSTPKNPSLTVLVLAVWLFAFLTIRDICAQDLPTLDLGGVIEQRQMIPMRDGKHLFALLYMPPGDGPWPVLFEQRYADIQGEGTRRSAARLAQAGYVVAMVNYRGTWKSEGTWVGYRALGWGELKDGYDTCEWLATEKWSTGKVGTFGSSQAGYAQNFLAITQPPHLTAQYMVDTGLSLFHEGYRIGGTTRPERFKALRQVCRNPQDNDRLMQEWFEHPTYDEYWQDEDCSRHFSKMNVPCFTIGSWYDFMNQGSIDSFRGRQTQGGQNSRGYQQLVIGPWLHGRLNKGHQVGQLTYPKEAAWPEVDHMVRWFDYWLKGKDTGVMSEPPVRYFVMGALNEQDAPGNIWREAKDFPPDHQMQSFYFQTSGRLTNESPGDESAWTSWISDPRAPCEIPGTSFPGAHDAQGFETQSQVRTFTTEVLSHPIEWTGRIRAELFFSSTAKDTDIIVRVSDVYPDGRSILIVDYPQRLRYRQGFDKEVLLTPNEIVPVDFDVGWISQIFNKGHRIRVTIASTGAPLYEPNPQTGAKETIDWPNDPVVATNTIYHNRRHASKIMAPIRP